MKLLVLSLTFLSVGVGPAIAQKPDSSKSPEVKTVSVTTAKLPAGREVVDRYVKAIGGRAALTKHRSRFQSGTVELSPMGVKGTVESWARSDNRSLTKVSLAGVGDIVDAFDGTVAWTSNPVQGSRVKEGKELQQSKRTSTFAREADLASYYSSLVVRGIEKVGDRDAYVLVGSAEGLPDDVLYFDTETGLMLRSDSIVIAPEGQQATSTFYDDYREVDGVKSAFKIRAKTPAFEIITALTEIKYDVAIEDAKFSRPN